MSLWGRLKQRARRIIERFTEPVPPDYGEGGGGGGSLLPDGWAVVGLYHDGEQTNHIHATDDTDITDADIGQADAIIVHYTDAGGDGYRWIHGASGWDSIADQIERVTKVVSPVGRGE